VNACPVCGETAIHHERVYTINGQRVTLRFSDCLHDSEQNEGGANTGPLTPPSAAPRTS
jgi:hypothetical protein